MVTTFEAPILSRTIVANDTMEIVFDTSANPLTFIAGQYITVTVHGLEVLDMREQFRDFSIASSPDHAEKISILFRLSQGRFKQALITAPLGTQVTISGPKGIFTLPSSADKPIIFIAGGIGITPFLGMVRDPQTNGIYTVVLFYYNKSKNEAAYLEELNTASLQNDIFSFYPIYGIFNGSEIKKYLAEHTGSNFLFYIAGPPKMVALAQRFLIEEGIQDKNIKTEEFSGY